MKLWQAILIGCDRRAQAFGAMFEDSITGEIRSCALGAAYETEFGLPANGAVLDSLTVSLTDKFSVVPIKCPECGECHGDMEDAIAALNDDHEWPREKIALEFVKPIEEAMDNAG